MLPEQSAGNSDAANEILKSRIAPEGVESGIHPDPWHSSRSLEVSLLKRLQSLLLFTELGIGGRHDEAANITFLGHVQRLLRSRFASPLWPTCASAEAVVVITVGLFAKRIAFSAARSVSARCPNWA